MCINTIIYIILLLIIIIICKYYYKNNTFKNIDVKLLSNEDQKFLEYAKKYCHKKIKLFLTKDNQTLYYKNSFFEKFNENGEVFFQDIFYMNSELNDILLINCYQSGRIELIYKNATYPYHKFETILIKNILKKLELI